MELAESSEELPTLRRDALNRSLEVKSKKLDQEPTHPSFALNPHYALRTLGKPTSLDNEVSVMDATFSTEFLVNTYLEMKKQTMPRVELDSDVKKLQLMPNRLDDSLDSTDLNKILSI